MLQHTCDVWSQGAIRQCVGWCRHGVQYWTTWHWTEAITALNWSSTVLNYMALTWSNHGAELKQYSTELHGTELKQYSTELHGTELKQSWHCTEAVQYWTTWHWTEAITALNWSSTCRMVWYVCAAYSVNCVVTAVMQHNTMMCLQHCWLSWQHPIIRTVEEFTLLANHEHLNTTVTF